jgi:sporulation protein YlmC with PRC-barrel domain
MLMRASDLAGKTVRLEDGDVLGHVREIQVDGSCVVSLFCGAGGFWRRLANSGRGHRVPWADVLHVTPEEIVVVSGKPK